MAKSKNNARSAFEIKNPEGLYDPSPFGYSHMAIVKPGARLIFLAGQGGENEKGEHLVDFRGQVRQAFANVNAALAAAGAKASDIVKLTIMIVDHSEDKLGIYGEEFGRAFGANVKPPATLIPVPRLALDSMLFEVEAVAAVSD